MWWLIITGASVVSAAVMIWWFMIRMPGESYRGELPPVDAEPTSLPGTDVQATSLPGDLPTAETELASLVRELRGHVTRLSVDIGERNVVNRPKELAEAADYIDAQFTAAGYKAAR